MNGLAGTAPKWIAVSAITAIASVAAMWAGAPVYVLVGFAATAAFLAIVVHSPESTTARNLALTALGAAWFIAPLSGIPAFGLLTFPELILAWAAAATFIPPRRQMSAGEMFGWSPVWYVVFIGVGALVGGMLIGGGVTQANLLHVARLFASSLTALVILRRFDPTPRELRWLAAAWVGGAMTSAVWAFTGGVAPSGRLEGFTSHPNQLAMISTMALPVIIILTSSDRFGLLRDTPVIRRAITVGGVTTLLAASIMSGSRSGLLALAAVLALIAYRYLGVIATAVIGTLAGAAVLLSNVIQSSSGASSTSAIARITSDDLTTNSDEERAQLLTDEWNEICTGLTSVFGRGFGTEGDGFRPHNIFLEVWGAAGILGLIGLAGIVLPILVGAVRRRRETHPMAVALCVGFIAYLISMAFNNAFELPYAWTFYALWERWRTVPCNEQTEKVEALSSPSSEGLGAAPRFLPLISPTIPMSISRR